MAQDHMAADHMMADHMAASSTPLPSSTTAQSPATPASATLPASTTPPGSGDAAAGRLVFRKCQACHSIEPGRNMLGPSLAGVIGRKAGTESGYNYSPAMKSADIVWNPQTLD
jgi:cytochrome c2